MQFVRGGTNFLWMSTEGELPPPKVESVLYDFDEGDEDRDEGLIVCSFTIDKPLVSSFWGERFEAGEVASTTYANYILPNN
jgi:hypothetical protein